MELFTYLTSCVCLFWLLVFVNWEFMLKLCFVNLCCRIWDLWIPHRVLTGRRLEWVRWRLDLDLLGIRWIIRIFSLLFFHGSVSLGVEKLALLGLALLLFLCIYNKYSWVARTMIVFFDLFVCNYPYLYFF